MVNYEKVEDTFFESFDGMYIRALITAEDELTVKEAAYDATATPSAVIGRVEAGVEAFVDGDKTPDGRPGAIVQFWLTDDLVKFEKELSYRIRQDILVKPFTRVFSITENPVGSIGMMESVGHCGDGYEWEIEEFEKVFYNKEAPIIEIITDENRDYLLKLSKEMRNSIRGKDIGGLG